MRHWAIAHAVDDFYQGLVPASIPFFVLERHYSYTAASGLALAATLGCSLPQPLFGVLADRRSLPWLAPLGLTVAGVGAGMAGLAPVYPLVWVLLLVSGLGVAAFHPAAGRAARQAAGDSASSMSLFATGGSVGFFLAPVLATPALVALGVGATALFLPPAVLTGYVLWRHQLRTGGRTGSRATGSGRDRWAPFALLTGVEVVRSVVYFGMNTFVALFWIQHFGASRGLGGTALGVFLTGGVAGTLAGGRLADRIGATRTVRLGAAAAVPALLLVRLAPGPTTGLLLVLSAGVAINIPFAVLVKLGQDYLPTRPGTAAGVTLGLAVSIGGLFVPALGLLADHHGTPAAMAVLCVIAAVATALAWFLPEPDTTA
ncbi:MFS transporter [Nocardia stercoris]|uniref:MFS transporter n=2 Tax=Nocardia stercoris TaxID=2483361 RepID=A0A3M2LAE2_9NOCA|nr:MFS transporter [Nocardia stercoris]